MIKIQNSRFPRRIFTLLSIEYKNGEKYFNVIDEKGRKFSFESIYCDLLLASDSGKLIKLSLDGLGSRDEATR